MTKYYFHVEKGVRHVDEEVEELPHDAAAKLLAEQIASELTLAGTADIPNKVIVFNEDGEQIAEVPTVWRE